MWKDGAAQDTGVVVVGASTVCADAVRSVFGGRSLVDVLEAVRSEAQRDRSWVRYADVADLHPSSESELDATVKEEVGKAETRRSAKSVDGRKLQVATVDALRRFVGKVPSPPEAGFLEQPVAFVFVTMISDAEAVTVLRVLTEATFQALPESYRNGLKSAADAARTYVLLRRPEDGDATVSRALNSARSAFGVRAVHLVELSAETAGDTAPPPLEMLHTEIETRLVIPLLDSRATDLAAQVERTRRGVRNTFRSLFRASDRQRPGILFPEGPEGTPVFLLESAESQLRLLADTQFLQRDYELALSNYRLAATDYRLMRAYVAHGATMEMCAHCILKGGGIPREAADCFRIAIDSYVRADSWLLVLRATAELLELCLSNNSLESASSAGLRAVSVLPRTAAVTTIGAAVCLEMAALCNERASPMGRTRKATLYSYLAAENYAAAGLHEHAIANLEECLRVLDGDQWTPLEDDIHRLATQSELQLGHHDRAFLHASRLPRASDAPTSSQIKRIEQLFSVVSRWQDDNGSGTRRPLPPLAFPDFLLHSAILGTLDRPITSYNDRFDWTELEDRASQEAAGGGGGPGGAAQRPFATLRPPGRGSALYDTQLYPLPGGCVAGEPLTLSVYVTNPMRVAIFLFDVRAVCTFAAADGAANSGDDGGRDGDHSADVEAVPIPNIMLQAQASVELKLALRPRRPGELRVVAVRWRVSNNASGNLACDGERSLLRHGGRLNRTKAQRTSETPVYDEDLSLRVKVTPPLPRLEAALTIGARPCAPDAEGAVALSLREGEVVRSHLSVELASQPDAAARVESAALVLGDADVLYWSGTQEQGLRLRGVDDGVEPRAIELWFRGAATASTGRPSALARDNAVRGVLAYSCVDEHGKSTVRLVRVVIAVRVVPSMSAFPRFLRYRVAQGAPEYLLGVEVERDDTAAGNELRVECVEVLSGGVWNATGLPDATPLDGGASAPQAPAVLRVNETATVFVRLHRSGAPGAETAHSQRVYIGGGPRSGGAQTSESRLLATEHFMRLEHERAHMEEVEQAGDVAKVVVHWREPATDSEGEIYLPPLVPSQWIDEGTGDVPRRDVADVPGPAAPGLYSSESQLELRCSHAERVEAEIRRTGVPAVLPVDVIVRSPPMATECASANFAVLPSSIADRSRGRYWSGPVQTALTGLAPGAQRRVRLCAILTSYSTFDLSELSLTPVRQQDAPEVAGLPRGQFASIVPSKVTVVESEDPADVHEHGRHPRRPTPPEFELAEVPKFPSAPKFPPMPE